jgi:uroporphyrinogen-III decarboxylase
MTATMTGRQRMLAAYRGQPVDRAPIWLREGFPVGEPYPAPDDFSNGWMHEPLYQALYQDIAPHADAMVGWGFGGWGNRYLMVPPDCIHTTERQISPDAIRIYGTITTPRGDLTFINERKRHDATTWYVKPPVETVEDLKKLAEVPFSVSPGDLEPYLAHYQEALDTVGERGVVRTSFSSPIVCISHCMSFDTFLEMTITQNHFFHELLQELTRRGLAIIDALFGGRALDTVVNFGGSEQCTPPMMAPQAFDEFVVPYDGPMVARLKEYGIITSCHCHGKIRHALRCIRDMGFDGTDPVEPPPAGDVTYAEAREIVGDQVTLIGNLEWSELCFAEPAHIRNRVKELLSLGNRRLILSTSAGPTGPITPRLAENYRAFVETALEYGG